MRRYKGDSVTGSFASLIGEKPDGATAHRPRDRREFQRAARDLMAQGLTTDDVARVLGITRRAVLDLLAEHLAEVPAKYRRPDL